MVVGVLYHLMVHTNVFNINTIMETKYTWEILAFDRIIKEDSLDYVISNVHWRLTATRDGKSVNTYSCLLLQAPKEGNFTKYEDITKEQVISWIKNSFNHIPETLESEQKETKTILEKLEESLNKSLDELLNKNNDIVIPNF